MGVYIKGMKMPKSCSNCPLCYDLMDCSASDISFFKVKEQMFDFSTERHPNCPLVTVPSHGRLIDADILAAKCDDPYWCVWLSDIDDAPTIIQAEEDE